MLYIFLLILGASIGSFINVVVYRMPLAMSIAKGRSQCPHCSFQLKWFDLIPLFSFIFLKRQCRNCEEKISWNYFFIELVSGFLALSLWLVFIPNLWQFAFWLCISYFLLLLFLFDLRYLILPDKILAQMLAFGIVFSIIANFMHMPVVMHGYLEGIAGIVAIAGFFLIIWLVSRGKWIGFGDVKLGIVIGAIFGLTYGIFIIYLAAILGGLVAVLLLVTGRANMKTKLPLGSFITLSGILYIIFNQPIHIFINNLFI